VNEFFVTPLKHANLCCRISKGVFDDNSWWPLEKIAAMELHTVDGRHPAPPGIYQTPLNNGINYQHQLVSRISSINNISNFFTSGFAIFLSTLMVSEGRLKAQ